MSVVLAARGVQDQYLTGNPNTFFFKSVYKQYVDFEVISEQQIVKNKNPARNTTFYIDIQNKYEYLSKIYCSFTSETQYNSFSQFEYVSLEIGGQTIVTLPFEYIYNANRLKLNDEQAKIYNNNSYGSNVDLDLNEENIPQFVYYMEFPFFMKDYENSLPLYLLQYHNVRLKFKTSAVSHITNFKIYTDYIHVNRKFLPKDYSIMMEQVQSATYNVDKVIELEFNNPIKEIFWLFRKEVFGDYAYNSIFNEMKIQLNGIDTFTRENYFYNLIQPLQYHTNIPKDVFMFSFSLRPEALQPFGTLNASRLKTFSLIFDQVSTTERKLITDYTDFQKGVDNLINTIDFHNTLINFNKDKIPLTFGTLQDIIDEYYNKRKPDAYDTTTNYSSIEEELRTVTNDTANNIEIVANLNITNTISTFNMLYFYSKTDIVNPSPLLKNITRREVTYTTATNVIQTHNVLDGGFMIGKQHSFMIENSNITLSSLNRLGQTELNNNDVPITSVSYRFLNVVFIPDLVDRVVTTLLQQKALIDNGQGTTVSFLAKSATDQEVKLVTSSVSTEAEAINYFKYMITMFPFDAEHNIYLDIRTLFSNDFDTYFPFVYTSYFNSAERLKNFLNDQTGDALSNDIRASPYTRYGTFIAPFRKWDVERDNASNKTFTIGTDTYYYPTTRNNTAITRIQLFPVDRYIITGELRNLYPNMINPETTERDTYYTSFSASIRDILNVKQSNLDPSSGEFIPFFYFYMISVLTFISFLVKKVAVLFYQLPYKEGVPVQDTNIITSTVKDIQIYAVNYNILDFKEGKSGLRFQS